MNTTEMTSALRSFNGFMVQVFDGNPMDMIVQGMVGMVGAVISVWVKVNPFVGIYCALVVVDTVLGVKAARMKGKPFQWSRLLWGPGEKVVFAALMLVAAQYMEEFVGQWLTRSLGAYISAVLFLEAVGKYDEITGANVLAHIRGRIASMITNPKRKKP